MNKLCLYPGSVTLAQLAEIYWNEVPIILDVSCKSAVADAATHVAIAAKSEKAIYGINTGFGKLASVKIAPEDTATLQQNLILSHCYGVGKAIDIMRPFKNDYIFK